MMTKSKGQQWVAIDSIWLDERLQAREQLSDETLDEYVELFEDPENDWPFTEAVTLVDYKNELYCVDGFHRITAGSRIAHVTRVLAVIEKVETWHECVRLALGANGKHGLRRSKADKRKAVTIALKEFSESSIKDIAAMCDVSVGLVSKLANELKTPAFIERQKTHGATQKKNKPPLTQVEEVKTRKPCHCGANAWTLTDGGWKCCVCFAIEGGKPVQQLSKDRKAARSAYGKLVRELDAIDILDQCRVALNTIVKAIG